MIKQPLGMARLPELLQHIYSSYFQALNEEKCIEVTLRAVQALDPPPHEIIVVDGGSHDR